MLMIVWKLTNWPMHMAVKVHDVKKDSIMVELSATPDQIKAFEELAKPFGIIDVARTGVAALQRSGAE